MDSKNTFVSALTNASNIVQNRNGGEMISTSGDFRVDAFTNLNKDTPIEDIICKICNMLEQAEGNSDIGEYISDIFKLFVHKRHAREGEKEKLLSYRYFLELYEHYPKTCIEIAKSPLFGEIGYWKDYYLIWKIINSNDQTDIERYTKYDKLIRGFRHSIMTQRQKDLHNLKTYIGIKKLNSIDNKTIETMIKEISDKNESKLSVSYVGKYCIREKSPQNKELFWYIEMDGLIKREPNVSYMIRGTLKNNDIPYPSYKSVPFNAKKTYRNMNTKLNIVLNVPECYMCAGRFGEMDPTTFPSVFMKKNAKGLLNEKLKIPPTYIEQETGNRNPSDSGRIELRGKMKAMFSDSSKVNAGQVFPHEIAYKISSVTSTMEYDMYDAMWKSKIEETKNKLNETRLKIITEFGDKYNKDQIRQALTSGNFIGCADVSGSMAFEGQVPNRPIDIAVGLTLFMSEIASPTFRNIALSFTDTPRIMNFNGMTLKEKINKINTDVGYSTNYQGIHQALIDVCIQNKVKEEDIPVIVVYTDGDFNTMDVSVKHRWDTIHSKIVSMWVVAGYTKIPTMVYWNLNARSLGVQVEQNRKGVMFLQGRSSTNIKYILYGECAEESEQIIDGKKVKVTSVTPYEIFRKAMNQDYFKDIHSILKKSNEGLLQYYN